MNLNDHPRKFLVDTPWKPGSPGAPRSMGVSLARPGMANWAIVTLEPTSSATLPYPFGSRTLDLLIAQSTISSDFTFSSCYVTSVYKRAGISGQLQKKKFTIARRREAYSRMVSELRSALGTPENPEEYQLVRPARILAFGTAVADLLAPNFETISEDHGTFFYNPDLHAYIIPAPLLQYSWQNPVRREWVQRDLTRLFTLPDPIPPEYVLDTSPDDIAIDWGDTVFFDVETTGVEYFLDHITLLGYSVNGENVVHIAKEPSDEYLEKFMYSFKKVERLIGHNVSFDLGMVITSVQDPDGIPPVAISDTMVMAYILGHEKKSLKHLTSLLTDRPGSRAYGGFTSLGYLAEDVLSTRDLFYALDEPSSQIFARSLLENLILKFANMRFLGVEIQHDLLSELESDYSSRLATSVAGLRSFKLGQETNFNAPAQLSAYLLANGVKLTEKTESGQFSTSEAVLLTLDHPLCKAILEYRALSKDYQWLTSYIKFSSASPFRRLHPRMNLTQARTGRTSCADPNLQQVPRIGPVKQIFISRFKNGYIGLVDLAQAELRVAALLSEDPAFIEALNSDDVHRAMAAKVFKKPEAEVSPAERKRSKGVTFGKLYGGSNAGLAKRMGLGEQEVAQVEKALFEAFPILASTLDQLEEIGVTSGQISTPFGRIRDLREIIAIEGENSAGRKAKNTPIQSVASDIMLVVTNTAQDFLDEVGAQSHIIFGVHDSGLYDVHPDEVQLVAEAVSRGFQALKQTPLNKFKTFGDIVFSGELILGPTWAHVEDTNEAAAPEYIFACSSHSDGPVLRKVTHYRDVSHAAVDAELEPVLNAIRDEAADDKEESVNTEDETTLQPS